VVVVVEHEDDTIPSLPPALALLALLLLLPIERIFETESHLTIFFVCADCFSLVLVTCPYCFANGVFL
jgi:hypothetical protein